MSAPIGTPPALKRYLDALETRLGVIENPQQPMAMFPIASANLSLANAKTYINRSVYVTDLNIIAHSNGLHWYREDTQGVIV